METINIAECYYKQIAALLDLIQCSSESVDIESINTAAEMCQNMLLDMMSEIKLGLQTN